MRMAPLRPAETPPMPTETNTSHTDKMLWKNLAGASTLLQGFGGYTRGCASAPPRNSTATRREESPISKRQPPRVPNGYHHRGSGATVRDSHKGPLVTGENPPFRKIIKCKRARHEPKNTPRVVAAQNGKAHDPKKPQRLTYRPAAVPLGRFSASLEGQTPPRAITSRNTPIHDVLLVTMQNFVTE
jgi:hypothetical protein